MRFSARTVALVFPFVLTGCFYRNHQPKGQPVAPPLVSADSAKPEPTPTEIPPTVIPPASQPTVSGANTIPPPQTATKPPVHHKKPAPKNPQVASNGNGAGNGTGAADGGVSAIGQLSSGEPSDLSRKTLDYIAGTERGLNTLNRNLSEPEQKTVAHIREFLKQARTALASGDVDGAHTLAEKARILLGELTR